MSTSSVDQVQSGTSGQSIINQYQGIINITTPAPRQLQHELKPNQAFRATRQQLNQLRLSVVTLPQSEQKIVGHEDADSPFEFVLIFIGAVILVVVPGFAVYSGKKTQPLNTKY